MRRTNLLLIGIIAYGLLSCTKIEYVEIERIEIKEDVPPKNTIFKLEKQSALIAANEWNSICYGQSQYIAVSDGGYFTSSLDGETWSEPIHIHEEKLIDWKNVEYSNGIFVVSGENQTGHCVSFSKDGKIWSKPVMDSGNGRIAFGNNVWVICDSYCIYVWDKDFTHKEQMEPSYDNARVDYYDVTFGNGKFILVTSCANDGLLQTGRIGRNTVRYPQTSSRQESNMRMEIISSQEH